VAEIDGGVPGQLTQHDFVYQIFKEESRTLVHILGKYRPSIVHRNKMEVRLIITFRRMSQRSQEWKDKYGEMYTEELSKQEATDEAEKRYVT
jgi:hypothetical protein